MFVLAVQAANLLESWATNGPFQPLHVEMSARVLAQAAWLILSWVAYRGMQNRIQRPWVYATTVVCLAGWCWFAFTTNSLTISHAGTPLADQQRIGSWIATFFTALVFLRFTFSRQNLVYFRVVNQ